MKPLRTGVRSSANCAGSEPNEASLGRRDRMSCQSAFVPRRVTEGMPQARIMPNSKYFCRVPIIRMEAVTVSVGVVVLKEGSIQERRSGSLTDLARSLVICVAKTDQSKLWIVPPATRKSFFFPEWETKVERRDSA